MSYDDTFGYSAIQGKLWRAFQETVACIRKGEKCILFARDYVMISRSAYDAMIKDQYPDKFEVRYDELDMNNWIKKRFLDSGNG